MSIEAIVTDTKVTTSKEAMKDVFGYNILSKVKRINGKITWEDLIKGTAILATFTAAIVAMVTVMLQ